MRPFPLIGRDHELRELDDRLRTGRLVTIVGPGGVGKTALAAAASQRSIPRFTSGVRQVDLTRVDEEVDVPRALAAQLGFDSFDALLNSPADHPILLCVDNCEHLLDTVAHWLVQILGSCEQATILATSRSPLELPGESLLPLAPLALPGPGDDAGSAPAVQLFLQCCNEAGAGVGAVDLPVVAELCRRVDGLPLAIEIAAARARTMSIAEMVQRLDGSGDVLDRPRFRGDRRHRSVGDTIGWSYDLLSPEAAVLLEELAVFGGPFSASTARAVTTDEAVPFDTLLDELVNASLLAVDARGSETRYRELETVRRFAHDRLRRRGALDSAYDRFADHIVASVGELVRGSTRTWRPGLLSDLMAVFDDLAEALRWCTAHDSEPRRAYILCATLWGVVHQGRADEVVELARATLTRWPEHDSPMAAQCAAALATAEYVTGHPERALELVESTLATLVPPGLASVTLHRVQGQARRAVGDVDGAFRSFRDGAMIAQEQGMESMAMELEVAAAIVSADQGEVHTAVAVLSELVERAATLESVLTESWARAAWGWLLLRVDANAALAVVEGSLADTRQFDFPIATAVDLRSLAYAHLLLEDLPGAVDAAWDLLSDLVERGALSNARLLVDVTAVLAHACGHPSWAALAATARALPITTLTAAQHELVPLPHSEVPPVGRYQVIGTVRAVLEELRASSAARPATSENEPEPVPPCWIESRGDTYDIAFAGREISIRRSKGLGDITRLIEAGGREIHCLDLARAGVEEPTTGPLLDDTARHDYEQRIRELQGELEEAEEHHDLGRTYKVQVELDAIIEQLTVAVGIGNKSRTAAGTAERARSAVTHRIRAAIGQVDKVHPNLGRHLQHALNTGTYCSYRPERTTTWRIA